MTDLKLPPIAEDEFLYISNDGLKRLTRTWDPKNPQKNFNWTTDYTLELPIRLKKTGPGTPKTSFHLIILILTRLEPHLSPS